MSIYPSPIEVFNAAVVSVGEEPITENDTSQEANLFRSSYERVVRAALSAHKWSFATKTEVLVRQGESGNTPAHVYQPTAEVLKAHLCSLNGAKVTNYELRGGKLLSDIKSDELVLHYAFRADEPSWSEDFTAAIVTMLEAAIYRGPLGDVVEGREREQEAKRMMLDALARDANSHRAPARLGRAPLIDAWRGVRGGA